MRRNDSKGMPPTTTTQKPVFGIKPEMMAYLLLTVAYVGSGKLGLLLALPPGYASPIFPPAGIAVAAAFIGGRKTLPWIFLGSLILNVWVGYTSSQHVVSMDLAVASAIAVASMLQAALGGWGIRQMIGPPGSAVSVREIALFLLLAPLICVTSATLSVGGLWALGIIGGADFAAHWVSWWAGDTLGVVAMFPLVLAVASEPRTFRLTKIREVALPIVLVLATGFVAVYFLQQAALNAARQSQRDYFEYQGREIALRIEQRLAAYAQVMRGVRGLYLASERVERNEFRDYLSSMELAERYPGIQGVGYAVVIQPNDLAKHIASMRSQGFPAYTVAPQGKRELYTSIVYLEPFSGRNLRAFGYDMYSEPVRRSAMEQARDLDKTIMSGKVILVQETGREIQAGFLMYLPVYRNGSPHASVGERRANIIGWIYAAFRMNDLMGGILGEQVHNVDLEIYDGANVNTEALMYDSRSGQLHVGTPLFHYLRNIHTLGYDWTITLHSLPAFEANMDTGRITVIRTSGLLISLLLALLVWQLASGRARALKLAQEITSELRSSEEQLREAQRVAHIGSWELDVASNRWSWSDEIYRIFEVDRESVGASYQAFLDAVHPEDRALVDAAFQESVAHRAPYSIEHRLLLPDGRTKYVHEQGETLYDETRQALISIGTVQDVTERKLTQERIEHMAHYDTLTNLPNRALFYERLRRGLSLARRNRGGLTLLFMDLDGFKEVNDTMGHHAGDLLLVGVAQRLSHCVRESDTVSRLGGDEFTVILNGMHKQEEVVAIAQKIIQAISVPFDLEGSIAKIGISIGIARYTEDADNEDDLVREADQAMYAAKTAGKNTYRFAETG